MTDWEGTFSSPYRDDDVAPVTQTPVRRGRVAIVSPAGTASAVQLDDVSVPSLTIGGTRYDKHIYQPPESSQGYTIFTAIWPIPRRFTAKLYSVLVVIDDDSHWSR